MTKKLYDIDSHLKRFSAVVLSCAQTEKGWRVLLDQTAFFPEGGGQPADTGVLGGAHIADVQEEPDGIAHYADAPLTVGATVRGEIDWAKRFRRMQAHSGEHIVSGLVHAKYGYNNVGFHLGDETVTMDYDGELTWEQLMELETLANEAVWKNVPIRAEYPAPEKLSQIEYRSKLDLKENVRIVTVEGYDVCACCAPHVSMTGEIGAIKIIDSMRHRGGVRLTILCGVDAMLHYRARFEQVTAVSRLLSSKRDEIVPAVERLMQEKEALEQALADRERKLTALRLQSLQETEGNLCIVDSFDDPIAMRELVNAGMERCGGVCGAFSGDDASGYRYIIGSLHMDLRERAGEINAAIHGRGGGKPTMIQGSCTATRAELEAFFQAFQK